MSIRSAAPSDAAAIASIHVEAWRVAYDGVVPTSFLDRLDVEERTSLWSRIFTGNLVVDELPRPSHYIVEEDGQVLGFANVGRSRDEPEDERAGELWAMYSAPSRWGTGVGDLLMQATMEEFRHAGHTRAFLWVLVENDRARRFYERHGWRSDGLTKDFDADGTNVAEIRYSLAVG